MSTPKDPLLEFEAPDRVSYATGVLLDATDFQAEQTYHRGRLSRALAYLHGYGTVAGLLVHHEKGSITPPIDEEIMVEAGVALDPLGRLCEVPRRACIRVEHWYTNQAPTDFRIHAKGEYQVSIADDSLPKNAVIADVFLRFRAQGRGKTPAFVAGPFDATDAVMPSRFRDGYELRLVMRNEATVPKVPKAPWPLPKGAKPFTEPPAPSDVNKRRAALQETLLSSWHADREAHLQAIRDDGFLPLSMRKKPSEPDGDDDPAWIFLSRVVIGVDATLKEDSRPKRIEGAVLVDNNERPFSLSSAAMAWWLGL